MEKRWACVAILAAAVALAWPGISLAQGGTGPGAIDALATLQAVQAQATAQAIAGQRDAAQSAEMEAAAAAEAQAAAARAASARAAAASAAAAARALATREASFRQAEIAAAAATSNAAVLQATLSAQATRTALDVQATQNAMSVLATRQAGEAHATATVQAAMAAATATAEYRTAQAQWQSERQRNTLAWAAVILAILGATGVGWRVVGVLNEWVRSFRPKPAIEGKQTVIDPPDEQPARMPEMVQVVDDPRVEDSIAAWAEQYDKAHGSAEEHEHAN